jgi:hypothetical protein
MLALDLMPEAPSGYPRLLRLNVWMRLQLRALRLYDFYPREDLIVQARLT